MSNVKSDYQKTLNLPKTDFSMRAGLSQKEPKFLRSWKEQGLHEQIKKDSKGRPPFILHDGPPYANGNIHIGHALNKILKDMIVKFKFMQGYDSYYLPGWDCHGLPIEHQLLKELKKRKGEIDCVEFRKKAHDYALKYVDVQREQFQRLGVFGEWDNPYLTLDPQYEHWILKSLAALNEKGYVYRGLKPVNWCYNCETALAEAEVEYEEHVSKSVFVKFRITKQIQGVDPGEKVSLLVWTTTPWTLVANMAVAIHPSFTYVKVRIGDEHVLVEETLVPRVMEQAGIKDYEVGPKLSSEHVRHATYQHPLDDNKKSCPVVTADYVTKEEGTGLVHTAPGHGQDDFQTGQKYRLGVFMPVDGRGIYTQEAGVVYAGMHVRKANAKIIEDLQNKGDLLAVQDLRHSYPHCWRCKNPIIFRATKQWFLNIDHDGLRTKAKEIIKNDVQWIPPMGEERILSMVSTRPDWCLSRQRYWGVPIPALACQKCGEQVLETKVIERFATLVKNNGTNVWFEQDVRDFIPDDFACPNCEGTAFDKTYDILDVWFDSGVSHQAVVKAMMDRDLPIDLYLEGSDQHRGWFQSSLISAVAMEHKAPFAGVLTHGFVVDGQGRKMSKSLGNVISPLDIIKDSGADILRLWVAASSYNEDIRISREILDRLVDAYRKIRNTFRYLLGNLYDFDPRENGVEYDHLNPIDRWALSRLAETIDRIEMSYGRYEFAKAYKSIYTFCNEDLSSFYLDILKDRLYTSATHSRERRAAQTVLYQITDYLVRVMAPIVSFTAEEIFLSMPKGPETKDVQSVHRLPWLKVPETWKDQTVSQEFDLLIAMRPYVLKALEEKRRSDEIGGSLEAKIIFETASDRDFAYLSQKEGILPAIFIVSQVEIRRTDTVSEGLSQEFSRTNIVIEKADGKKCGRCWNFRPDVGHDPEHQSLCARCTEIVKEF